MVVVLIIFAIVVAGIFINAQNNAYKTSGKKEDKVGCWTVIMWIIAGFIFVIGCLGNLMGACGGDLSKIGGQ